MKLKLGLIGNAIAKSRAPELHVFLGKLHGFEVKYDLFDLFQSTSDSFSTTFDHLQHLGYHGCNVTYPFKQVAMRSVHVCEPSSQLVGATNTVKFSSATQAINTDYSGFIRALTSKLPKAELGSSLILGAGGVGRAVAFGLASLSSGPCHIFDASADKAKELVDALLESEHDAVFVTDANLAAVSQRVTGILNCSPIGHYQSPGIPINPDCIGSQTWAFDAVYTPIDTEFLKACREANLQIVSGFELFFYQGLDSFEFWTASKVDEHDVKKAFLRDHDVDPGCLMIR